MSVYDAEQLRQAYIPEGRTDPIHEPTTFDVFGTDYSESKIGEDVRIVFAPLAATDLVKMNGIANQELFAWNVRQSLGKTNVNKDIAKSIQDASEHPYFLLYHNGLTVLCDSLETSDDRITISGYTVVNGCQSLSSLYDHRDKISTELRLQTRLIQIPPDSPLAYKISHHSNNQNGIRPRDLQSNSIIQARLQEEFSRKYQDEYFYQVKRGEVSSGSEEVLDNELAARVLLAFDLQEPWSCHQTGKLFDDHHARIFARPEVTSDRIAALYEGYKVIASSINQIDHQPMAQYTLTKFFMLYLVRRALETDAVGRRFCQTPGEFLEVPDRSVRLASCLESMVGELIIDLNAEVEARDDSGKPFDYKRELKNQKDVRSLSRNIVPQYERLVARKRVPSFGEEWDSSGDSR